jgi:hypothetical protein
MRLDKNKSFFRNELIFAIDAKAINIDNTLVNLFMLLKHNGTRPKPKIKSTDVTVEKLKEYLGELEKQGVLIGLSENTEAAEVWIRNNLVNMTNRGHSGKEKITSLRPIHLESYRVRNALPTRDYNSADQVYLMLGQNPRVKQDFIVFLQEGWDKKTKTIVDSDDLDVDSVGLLQIIKNMGTDFPDSPTNLNTVRPLLTQQAELYCDDIRRLLVYQGSIPRSVLIDYIKTLTSFHLSLYFQKLVYFLPKMIENGNTKIEDDWNIVVDVTDDFDSKVARIATDEVDKFMNSIYDYIKATFQINATLGYLNLERDNSDNIIKAFETLSKKEDRFELSFDIAYHSIYNEFDKEKSKLKEKQSQTIEHKEYISKITKYETSYFDKYVQILLHQRGPYQYKYSKELFDNICQKNKERGILAQGRSRKHQRRFVLGSRLLETLIQILVLEANADGFYTKSLSIEELMAALKERYGLVINGLGEARFKDADVNTHLAFRDNVVALKQKLRMIGFYNDLSDAYILQKIRPRYPKK